MDKSNEYSHPSAGKKEEKTTYAAVFVSETASIKLRKKIPIKIWYIIVGFLFLWIPVANIFASIIFLANTCPESSNYEFLIPKENKVVNIIVKIINFLNKDIS